MVFLEQLGYDLTEIGRVVPPPGRKAVFVGDLVDRGPRILDTLRLVRSIVSIRGIGNVLGNAD